MKRVPFAVLLVTRELATRISQSLLVIATVTSRAPWSVRRSRWNCPPSERWQSASSLATITSSRQTVTRQELRCKRQRPARVGQPSRKWRAKRFRNIEWRVSVVSCEVVHAPSQKGQEVWESPSNTSVWSENEGPRRMDGTRGGRFPIRTR